MNTPESIPVPPRTADRIRQLLAQRAAVDDQIATLVDVCAEALHVPQGWQVHHGAEGMMYFQPVTEGE